MQRDFERGGLRGEFVSAGKSLNLARIRRPNRFAWRQRRNLVAKAGSRTRRQSGISPECNRVKFVVLKWFKCGILAKRQKT